MSVVSAMSGVSVWYVLVAMSVVYAMSAVYVWVCPRSYLCNVCYVCCVCKSMHDYVLCWIRGCVGSVYNVCYVGCVWMG